MEEYTVRNGKFCLPDSIRDDLEMLVKGSRIAGWREGKDRGKAEGEAIDAGGRYVLPGFVELHCHGALLFEFTAGVYDPESKSFREEDEAWEIGIPAYARWLAASGVTSAYLATWAASPERVKRSFSHLKSYVGGGENGRDGTFFRGGFLEGTFINPEMAGAQSPESVLAPDPHVFDDLNESGIIKLVNAVPDFKEQSLWLIKHLVGKGITVGAGHTDATAEDFLKAVAAGLRYAIHFTNGPTGGSYKPFGGGGVIEAVLGEDSVYAELILDLFHINPRYLRDIIARKGIDRAIGITDQMFATGVDEVEVFSMGGVKGKLSEDRRYVQVVEKKNTLFSSVLTMDVAFANLLSLLTREGEGVWIARHPALDFPAALSACCRMLSANANRMVGTYEGGEHPTGALEVGKEADFIIADIVGEPGSYRLEVKRTFVRGREIPRAPAPLPVRLDPDRKK